MRTLSRVSAPTDRLAEPGTATAGEAGAYLDDGPIPASAIARSMGGEKQRADARHEGIKIHTCRAHECCTTIRNAATRCAAVHEYTVPSIEEPAETLSLGTIRDDIIFQIAMLWPIAEQRQADERRWRREEGWLHDGPLH